MTDVSVGQWARRSYPVVTTDPKLGATGWVRLCVNDLHGLEWLEDRVVVTVWLSLDVEPGPDEEGRFVAEAHDIAPMVGVDKSSRSSVLHATSKAKTVAVERRMSDESGFVQWDLMGGVARVIRWEPRRALEYTTTESEEE